MKVYCELEVISTSLPQQWTASIKTWQFYSPGNCAQEPTWAPEKIWALSLWSSGQSSWLQT
jgi:hypothetical protein